LSPDGLLQAEKAWLWTMKGTASGDIAELLIGGCWGKKFRPRRFRRESL